MGKTHSQKLVVKKEDGHCIYKPNKKLSILPFVRNVDCPRIKSDHNCKPTDARGIKLHALLSLLTIIITKHP